MKTYNWKCWNKRMPSFFKKHVIEVYKKSFFWLQLKKKKIIRSYSDYLGINSLVFVGGLLNHSLFSFCNFAL